ncbi:PspC domain-containing protein [Pseudoalteromonas spongiae]|uniref:PspC domain-containing protein n=1 Tax=Pseudoalteromonas spongiae TaxID=298657 RepID=UPI00373575E0
MKSHIHNGSFYKDRLNKKVSGVCAGLALGNSLPIWSVRLAAVAAVLVFPVATLLAYFVAATVLPARYY